MKVVSFRITPCQDVIVETVHLARQINFVCSAFSSCSNRAVLGQRDPSATIAVEHLNHPSFGLEMAIYASKVDVATVQIDEDLAAQEVLELVPPFSMVSNMSGSFGQHVDRMGWPHLVTEHALYSKSLTVFADRSSFATELLALYSQHTTTPVSLSYVVSFTWDHMWLARSSR